LILLVLTALVFYSNSKIARHLSFSSVSQAEGSLTKARELVRSTFDYEEERQLSDLLDQGTPPALPDTPVTQLVRANASRLSAVFSGKTVGLMDLPSGLNNVSADLREGWRGVEAAVAGLTPAAGSGIETFRKALGKYEKGMSYKEFPADQRGNGYLKQARRDFLQVLMAQPSPLVKDYSLYFLGDIGFHLWAEGEDLPGEVYMIEVIRSAQDSDLAQKAWFKLSAQVHFGFTGSSGDNTPSDWNHFLSQLRGLTVRDGGFPMASVSN
jgi:hypothetical protein